jgi:replicative DNA helicase
LRELLRGTIEAQEAIYADQDPQEIIAKLQHRISDEKNFSGSSLITSAEMSSKLFAAIETRSKSIDAFTGIPTGLQGLDKVMDGLVGSNLILVGGRPGMGKTAFSLNIARHVARTLPVGLISLEMSDQENGMRMLASETGEKLWKFRKGYIDKTEWSMVTSGIVALSNLQLFFADRSVRTLRAVESTIYNMAISKQYQLVIVDYIGLINVEGKNLNREREISMISDALKSLAMRFNIPIIALSQLNRSLEQRQDKRPTLADLRDSGSLEQDADIVLFLYRDDYYNEHSPTPGIVEVNVAKGRNIGTGIVKLRWDGQTQIFSDL